MEEEVASEEKSVKTPMLGDNDDDECEQGEAGSGRDGCGHGGCEHKYIHDYVHLNVYGLEEAEQVTVDTSHGTHIS